MPVTAMTPAGAVEVAIYLKTGAKQLLFQIRSKTSVERLLYG